MVVILIRSSPKLVWSFLTNLGVFLHQYPVNLNQRGYKALRYFYFINLSVNLFLLIKIWAPILVHSKTVTDLKNSLYYHLYATLLYNYKQSILL